jgi:site-specific DNA recombinase
MRSEEILRDSRTHKPSHIRAVGYIRVSTDEQANEGQSLDNQSARIKAYAESQGWELIGIYREEGYSGKVIERPELTRMIDDIKSGKINVVLVYKVDRLTRKQKDLWYLLEDVFEAHGAGFKSVVEPFDTTTAQGKAFLGMLAVFAQLERDTIAERTKDTLSNKKAKGEWTGRIPFGYRVSSDGRLELVPDQQKAIAKIKQYHRQGLSLRAIAKRVGLSHTTISTIINGHSKTRNRRYLKELRALAVN